MEVSCGSISRCHLHSHRCASAVGAVVLPLSIVLVVVVGSVTTTQNESEPGVTGPTFAWLLHMPTMHTSHRGHMQ
jgi:hypothetical protein